MSPHPIVHIELSAHDPQALGKFYADVFGWKTEAMPQLQYVTYEAEPGPGGGFSAIDDKVYKKGDIVPYIQTDDIEATLAVIERHGGKTVQGKTEIPGFGWFAFFSDTTGNRLGLYTGMGSGG